MRRVIIGMLCLLTAVNVSAQKAPVEASESLANTLHEWRMKDQAFDFYLHLHNSANAYFNQGDYSETNFKTNQLRLELKGVLGNGISYHLNHRLNSSTRAAGIDNLSRATDVAMVRMAIADDWFVAAGKQCLAFGGYEFDQYPINVYAYSDIVNHMESFLTGVEVGCRVSDQVFKLQVVNSRTDYVNEIYQNLPQSIERSKNPLGVTFAWNGKLAAGKLQTRWSYSAFQEAHEHYMHYWALGTQWQITNTLQLQFDAMFSDEDLDRKGLGTALINAPGESMLVAEEVQYQSYVAKLNWSVAPKWNVFAKGMFERVNMPNEEQFAEDCIRESHGYLSGLEYMPIPDLKIFAVYVGRDYKFADELQNREDTQVTHTDQISIGLIYLLQMF